jgi:excisionase family DNA binding protein
MTRENNAVLENPYRDAEEIKQEEEIGGDLLTVREVARRLRVDDTTVRRWIKSGALEAITLPHRGKRLAYRIKKLTLDLLMSSVLPEF